MSSGHNYIGLLTKYRINRPLTEWEKEDRLRQNRPTGAIAHHQKGIIKMNSTFLECCDKFFNQKGATVTMMTCWIVMFIWVLGFTAFFSVVDLFHIDPERRTHAPWEPISSFIIVYAILIPFILLSISWIKKEAFCFTHFPIRFNRKTRMVHVFRFDGTVMSESWDKLFFVTAPAQNSDWDVRGHRLAEDGVTVLETFALPFFEEPTKPELLSQWEFVRRYMEEGPGQLADKVDYALDIATRRETPRESWRILGSGGLFLDIIVFPFIFFGFIGRVFAMSTCKIPVWPQEIEEECKIEPDDPYIRDAQHLAARNDD